MQPKTILQITKKALVRRNDGFGLIFAGTILVAWSGLLLYDFLGIDYYWPSIIIRMITQAYLFTGLFITAHDAMHGNVHSNKKINNAIGQLCLWLYAAFPYSMLLKKHKIHHSKVATELDPDYSNHGFWRWYIGFVWPYISLGQLILMALIYNILNWIVGVSQFDLFFFWIVPVLTSTLQLFYFGTYLPHRDAEKISNRLKSRSLPKNHIVALVSCYFFGYHYEHHLFPRTPWWRLWSLVE